MNVLWHDTFFSDMLWRRRVASGGWADQVVVCAAMKFGHLCSWVHSSYCDSWCGKAVAISELLQRMQRSYLHCLLLLGFCNLNNSSTAMENIKGSISAYWPPWSINIPSSLPRSAPEIMSQSSVRSYCCAARTSACDTLWMGFFHCKYTQMSCLMSN